MCLIFRTVNCSNCRLVLSVFFQTTLTCPSEEGPERFFKSFFFLIEWDVVHTLLNVFFVGLCLIWLQSS